MTTTNEDFEDASVPDGEPEPPEVPDEQAAIHAALAEKEGPIVEMVRLDVFVALKFGKRADQARPFAQWAKKQGLKHLAMSDWEQQLESFQTRPVG